MLEVLLEHVSFVGFVEPKPSAVSEVLSFAGMLAVSFTKTDVDELWSLTGMV